MRCSKSAPDGRTPRRRAVALGALLVLGGCGAITQQTPGVLVVRSARVDAGGATPTLDIGLDCRLSGPMQDALEHGIPLTLRVDLRGGTWLNATRVSQRVELRYFPLSRRYQLRELGVDDVRNFATPAYLVAALGALRVSLPPTIAQLPASTPWTVSVALDPAALPGALRLPALFEPAWRLASADYAWTVAAR
jgi:hypothetical protein